MRNSMQLHKIVKNILYEEKSINNIDAKVKCVYGVIQKELEKYKNKVEKDDRWADIRDELRKFDSYFESGYFIANKSDEENLMTNFLNNLNYSDSNTYKKGEIVGNLPKSNNLSVYKAIGDKTLFRGVSLDDWYRIQRQGYIDSDMRGAILDTEGINLGQTPSTARYYLPPNTDGVILAISPKGLDLYMLRDEYIRVFNKIPKENILKVSDIISKCSYGSILTKNTEKKINDIINNLKKLNISVDC